MSIKDMTATDHVIAVGKAVLNLDPTSTTLGIGGFLSSLVGDYVPTSCQKAAEAAVKRLGEKVYELESRIEPEVVNKEEFAELSVRGHCAPDQSRAEAKRSRQHSCKPAPAARRPRQE